MFCVHGINELPPVLVHFFVVVQFLNIYMKVHAMLSFIYCDIRYMSTVLYDTIGFNAFCPWDKRNVQEMLDFCL